MEDMLVVFCLHFALCVYGSGVDRVSWVVSTRLLGRSTVSRKVKVVWSEEGLPGFDNLSNLILSHLPSNDSLPGCGSPWQPVENQMYILIST